MRRCALLLTLLLAARPASANPWIDSPGVSPLATEPQPERPRVSTGRRALAVTAAIVPGVILRGAGSYVVGEKRVSKKLLLGALGGLAFGGLAGALVGLSGANPYTTPAVPLVVSGTGVFLISWVADVWVAAGGDRTRMKPRGASAWAVELGQTWQHDAHRERLLGRAAGRVAFGRTELGGGLLVDTGGDASIGFADVRVQLLGDTTRGAELTGGNRLVARVGGRRQTDDDDRVAQWVGEVDVGGRLDLAQVDPLLHATFVELALGVGAVRATYVGEVSEIDSLILGRFAWGTYLPTGELVLYYDHRRDGIAGGIAAYRAAGFVGSFGLAADVGIRGPWAVRGEVQVGNAWLTTLAVAYRGGAR